MLNKVEIIAFSPKILTLGDDAIFSYFKDKKADYSKSDKWIFFDDKDGIKIKILKTGIVEIIEFIEGRNIKQKLIELANVTRNIAYNLFYSKAIYDVFINLNKNINLNIIRNFVKNDEKVESISFTLKNKTQVKIKATTTGYCIIIKGIDDIEDIMIIYDALINYNIESLKKIGCKDFKAVVNFI